MRQSVAIVFTILVFFIQIANADNSLNNTKNSFSISTGYIYTDTDRDNEFSATIRSFPISLKYKHNHWAFSFSVAHLKVKTFDWVVTEVYDDPSDPDYIIIEEELLLFEQEGFGDSVIGIQYSPEFSSLSRHKFTIGGKIKLPTGNDNEGLSSGKTDITLFIGDMYRINHLVFDGRIGIQKIGIEKDYIVNIVDDLETRQYESLDWDDVSDSSFSSNDWNFGDWYLDEPDQRQEKKSQRVYFSAGLLYLIDRKNSAGLSFYQRSAAHKGRNTTQKLNLFFSQRVNRDWSYTLFGAKGLNDASIDLSVGLQITRKM